MGNQPYSLLSWTACGKVALHTQALRKHTEEHTFGWSCSFGKIHCIGTRVFWQLFTFKGQAERDKTPPLPTHLCPTALCHLLQEQTQR